MNAYNQPRIKPTYGYDGVRLSVQGSGIRNFGYDTCAIWFGASDFVVKAGSATNLQRFTGKERADRWKIGSCLVKGAVVGAVGALAVGGLAVGAVTLGAPVAIVTGVLGVAAAVGGGFTLYDTAQQASNGNWAGVAHNVGTIAGAQLLAARLARGSGRASRGRRPAGALARTGGRAIAPITQVAHSANGSVPGRM